ncbi:MAG TPA: hypothetical protein VGV38_10915, partial [Pyrinomonadaceae bacterium]|nr:hypothetical protein [Pyrinomonadaceae bacterium]
KKAAGTNTPVAFFVPVRSSFYFTLPLTKRAPGMCRRMPNASINNAPANMITRRIIYHLRS